MKLQVNPSIVSKFPDLVIGVVIAKDIDNSEEFSQEKLRNQEKRIKEEFNTETLSQHPKISVWREAYRAFGAKPKEHRSSIENLYRTVLKGNDIRQINKLVDIYNFISLKHMLPVGGEDLDKIEGDILLTFASNEPQVLLLGDKESRSPKDGEVIYKDNISAICRRWNWREADRTKLTEETKNAILVVEGFSKEEVEKATKELKELVESICQGTINYSILDKDHPSTEL